MSETLVKTVRGTRGIITFEMMDGRKVEMSETQLLATWNNQAQTVVRLESELAAARQSRQRLVRYIRWLTSDTPPAFEWDTTSFPRVLEEAPTHFRIPETESAPRVK